MTEPYAWVAALRLWPVKRDGRRLQSIVSYKECFLGNLVVWALALSLVVMVIAASKVLPETIGRIEDRLLKPCRCWNQQGCLDALPRQHLERGRYRKVRFRKHRLVRPRECA